MSELPESDFGKGFYYPLALFLGHQMKLFAILDSYSNMRKNVLKEKKFKSVTVTAPASSTPEQLKAIGSMFPMVDEENLFTEERACELWMYGAADHLMEFDPELAPTPEMKKLAQSILDRALEWRLPLGRTGDRIDRKKANQLIVDAQEVFLLLDEHLGNKPIKATWN